MGNNKSVEEKREEKIVIAQNGANDASNSHWEQKIEVYGLVTISLISILLILSAFLLYKRCNRSVKKWARKELSSVAVVSTDKATIQPQFVAAQNATTPQINNFQK